MYQRILIATDGSDLAAKAVNHGISLAKVLRIPVVVATVTEAWSSLDLARSARHGSQNPVVQYQEMAAASANNILEKAGQIAKVQDVPCELIHIQDQHPAEGIIAAAAQKACDLIVMASHGRRGIARILLRSEERRVGKECRSRWS